MRKLRLRLSNLLEKQEQWARGSPQEKMGNKGGNHWRSRRWQHSEKERHDWDEPGTPHWQAYIHSHIPICVIFALVEILSVTIVFSKCFNSYSEFSLSNDFTLNLDKQKRDSVVGLKLNQSFFGDFSLLRALESSFLKWILVSETNQSQTNLRKHLESCNNYSKMST